MVESETKSKSEGFRIWFRHNIFKLLYINFKIQSQKGNANNWIFAANPGGGIYLFDWNIWRKYPRGWGGCFLEFRIVPRVLFWTRFNWTWLVWTFTYWKQSECNQIVSDFSLHWKTDFGFNRVNGLFLLHRKTNVCKLH